MPNQIDARKKSLWYSIIDGCAASMMIGFGENYLSVFAIFLKASNTVIGLLASMPQLIGTASQLISVNILDRIGKRKSLIITAVIIQMLAWIPIFFLPFVWRGIGPILLIAAVAIYISAGSFTAPAWNSLMGDLVEPDKRGHYFGKRSRFTSIFTFGSVLCAGFILHWLKPINEWVGFAIIFGIAFISRGISAYYLKKMVEPDYIVAVKDHFTFWDFIRRSPKSNFARFVFYVALINMSVMIAGPFFAVYMLRDLHFSYVQFTVGTAATTLTQFVVMRYWGKLCDRFGNKKILNITGVMISLVPIVWVLSPNFYWILAYQIFAGLFWSGFGLASGNFIFDAVSPPKRARCVAYLSLLNSIGMFLGATFGGWISAYLSDYLIIFGWHIVLTSSLQVLFLISGLLRLVISAVFLPHIKEVRKVETIPTWKLIFQIIQIRPLFGPIFEIFTGVSKDENKVD
ncbi:MAG: MFS transporter [Planctomycetota bacterium]